VLIERAGDVPGTFQGRAPWQADDIDGVVLLNAAGVAGIAPGALVEVGIDRIVDDYDFAATALAITAPAPVVQRQASRALPMMGVGAMPVSTVGSYGR
jgi:ribosomal protein S12 methylthiotransferase